MSKITNTTAQAERDPIGMLAEGMVFGSRAIERQESRGQTELVNSADLPTKIDAASRAVLVDAGVVFGEPHADDPIFCPATLPSGWRKSGTDHAMWSELLDANGRKRAMIFYKAAFYDRNAHMHTCARYSASCDYSEGPVTPEVRDGGILVWWGEPVPRPADRPWSASETAREIAQAWLIARRPDYQNPAAYWDDVDVLS